MWKENEACIRFSELVYFDSDQAGQQADNVEPLQARKSKIVVTFLPGIFCCNTDVLACCLV